jgi:hypothetical protein
MKKSLQKIKDESPEIPDNTCPYIDFLKDVIAEMKDESSGEFIDKKYEICETLIEYIRDSNDSLRTSSHYWYNKFVSSYGKK